MKQRTLVILQNQKQMSKQTNEQNTFTKSRAEIMINEVETVKKDR